MCKLSCEIHEVKQKRDPYQTSRMLRSTDDDLYKVTCVILSL